MTIEELNNGIETLHTKVINCNVDPDVYIGKASFLIDTSVTLLTSEVYINTPYNKDVKNDVKLSIIADIGKLLVMAMIAYDYDGFISIADKVYTEYTPSTYNSPHEAVLRFTSLTSSPIRVSESILTGFLDIVLAFELELDIVISKIFKDCE